MILISNAPTNDPISNEQKNWVKWFSQLVQAFNSLTATGTTDQRPNPAPFQGFMFFDTTLNKPIWAKTLTQYVDATGTNV
ncbi:MAG TPA: hypothetical protein VN039_05410 [Nitrospira sp.]|nr:hypothetical protein [Nitrospira sp.]